MHWPTVLRVSLWPHHIILITLLLQLVNNKQLNMIYSVKYEMKYSLLILSW